MKDNQVTRVFVRSFLLAFAEEKPDKVLCYLCFLKLTGLSPAFTRYLSMSTGRLAA